jgi:hypothetical protein
MFVCRAPPWLENMVTVFLPRNPSWLSPTRLSLPCQGSEQTRAGTKKDKIIDDKIIILKSFCRPLFCLLKSLPQKQKFQ